MSGKTRANELHIVRFYDAPLATVWEAWTDPDQAAKWWGPRGFTITTHGKDLRPGGHWSYTMHGPDGTDYPNKAIYLEVEHQAKLVYDHGGNDDRPPLFRVTVLFSEESGRTKMDMTMALPTAKAAAETRVFIKKAGGDGTWDRLAEYLEKGASGKEIFVINRSFDAPIDLVFDCWTDPARIAQWLPPADFTMEFSKADIRSGGSSAYRMGNAGLTMYGRANYIAVERPRRLVYTQQFSDEKGNVARHPLAPTWPETMLTVVTFTPLESGGTLVTIRWEVSGPATAEEMATFIAGRNGMTQGWTSSLDKFEAMLKP